MQTIQFLLNFLQAIRGWGGLTAWHMTVVLVPRLVLNPKSRGILLLLCGYEIPAKWCIYLYLLVHMAFERKLSKQLMLRLNWCFRSALYSYLTQSNGLSRRPQSLSTRSRGPHRRRAPHPSRRRLRQNSCHHPPHG